jgi:hypothetical protein
VAPVRTNFLEECSASIIRVTRIGELEMSAVTSNRRMLSRNTICMCRLSVMANIVSSSPILVTLMMEALCSSKTLVLTRPTRHNNPEDGILHSHRHENLKSYTETQLLDTICLIITLEISLLVTIYLTICNCCAVTRVVLARCRSVHSPSFPHCVHWVRSVEQQMKANYRARQ